jgi:hypothetical protein
MLLSATAGVGKKNSENLGLFRFVSVCYETVLFVSVVSILVRNTETNRNFLLLVSRNKPKQTRNRSCFGLFRFEPKFIFVCFEDTLLQINRTKINVLNIIVLQINGSLYCQASGVSSAVQTLPRPGLNSIRKMKSGCKQY